ncbi:MAG: OmpA family protein [Nitrospiraceae bacterium]
MRRLLGSGLVLSIIATTGCVSSETHSRALGHVNEARKAATDARNELDSFQKQSSVDMDAKEAERARLVGELAAAQSALASARSNVESLQGELDGRTKALRDTSSRLGSIEKEKHAANTRIGSLQVEKDIANARIATLERENEGANNRIASLEKEKEEANNRVALLEKDKNALAASVTEARDRVRDLETKVGSLTAQVGGLQNDNRSLLSGTTTAKDVIAKLQKRAGELESESARAADLAQRLNERDQELATLRSAASDREQLAGKLAALTDEAGKLAQDRDRWQQQQTQLSGEHQKLLARLQEDADKLKVEEAEKNRLEQERAAKEEEIRRLTKAQADLTKSLQDEIDKGNITIQRVRDRLTINMIDQVLFDSGQAVVKPAGLKVLKQVSDVLKDVPDKQIRIEGHTDNVPIGVKLRDKFETNWELSTTRATSVVRYLLDEGGVNRDMISAAGYADTRPVAANDSDDGKASNRRIEIVLYPKDLTDIVKDLRADSR